MYNVIQYINKYGMDWMEQLIEHELEKPFQHQLVYV
ncbi:hypothetical protein [Longirhabdus pacifica]|nr:hypothetical protein [Longirhabdus pacifica]